MIEFIIANFYTIGGAILLACFVGYINWRNGYKSRLASIAIEYKTSFAQEIASIRNEDVDFGAFIDAFQKHKAAVDAVMPLLSKRHQRKLHKAWDEYCGKGSGIDKETFITGSSHHPQLYPEFKNRFNTLHRCLDDLL